MKKFVSIILCIILTANFIPAQAIYSEKSNEKQIVDYSELYEVADELLVLGKPADSSAEINTTSKRIIDTVDYSELNDGNDENAVWGAPEENNIMFDSASIAENTIDYSKLNDVIENGEVWGEPINTPMICLRLAAGDRSYRRLFRVDRCY